MPPKYPLRRRIAPALLCAAAGILAGRASGQALHSTRVAFGLNRPTSACVAPTDANRLFVTEQWTGNVRVVKNGILLAAPFVNVGPLATGTEQGLLGIAFHPNYQNNGKFYVDLVDPSGMTNVREYRVSGANADLADPTSARPILSFAQPFTNHNGGCLQFGQDGYLYISSGDGGSLNDVDGNSQNTNVLLGKILRVDVDSDAFPADATRNYAIPPTNPFAGAIPGADEVWHYGLRNPWRFSFDRGTGDMYIADVGEGAWEEVDFAPAGVGALNFGWRCMEGNACTGFAGCTCNAPTLTLPIHAYSHSQGCSITGGFVYRGAGIPALHGTYFFTDYCTSRIWSFTTSGGGAHGPIVDRTAELTPVGGGTIANIVSFAEDARGELLMVEQTGEIWRIDGPPPGSIVCPTETVPASGCPCTNAGTNGRGCSNSVSPAGAGLVADGTTNPDTIHFTIDGLPSSTTCLVLKSNGFSAIGTVFGDGVLCLSGTLVRMRTVAASGGSASYPAAGDLPVSVRSQTVVGSGASAWYQVYYRNAGAFCTPQTFNTTNGYTLVW